MEEDIKIIEEMIEVYRSCVPEEDFDMRVDIGFMKEEVRALENLLTKYKQLEEKNKTQLEAFELGKESSRKRIEYDYIPKSKVKEKIEELKKEIEELQERFNETKGIEFCNAILVQIKNKRKTIKVLQELLREE